MDTPKVCMFAFAMALVLLATNLSPVAAETPEGEAENGADRGTAAVGIAVMSTALANLVAKMM